jgi:phage repressor protein C with HTH and peptisase S24 domain
VNITFRPELTAERLRARMDEARIDQEQLASLVGCSQGAISQILTERTRNSRFLPKISQVLSVSLAWLQGASDNPEEGSATVSQDSIADQLDAVMIKEVDIALGLGGTYLDGPVAERMIPFPRDWLRQFTDAPPEQLAFAKGKGDSMKPTIQDGDLCLIDLGRRRLDEQDALWAVAFGELGMIKRLRQMPDGSVKIMSDNENVRTETATDGELYLLGRVCAVVRKP